MPSIYICTLKKHLFAEAIEGMAEDAGIAIEKSDDPNQQHLDTLKKVSRAFEQSLRESQAAISYLKSRGLSGQVAKDFALGYSVQNIRELCRLSGFGVKRLVDAGLVLSFNGMVNPTRDFKLAKNYVSDPQCNRASCWVRWAYSRKRRAKISKLGRSSLV